MAGSPRPPLECIESIHRFERALALVRTMGVAAVKVRAGRTQKHSDDRTGAADGVHAQSPNRHPNIRLLAPIDRTLMTFLLERCAAPLRAFTVQYQKAKVFCVHQAGASSIRRRCKHSSSSRSGFLSHLSRQNRGLLPSPCTASPSPFAGQRRVHHVCLACSFLWPAPHSSVFSTPPIEQVTNVFTRATPCARTHPSTVQCASRHFFPARAQLFRNVAHSRPHARRRLDSVVSSIVQCSRQDCPSHDSDSE